MRSWETVIPYYDSGKKKQRRYFMDLTIKFADGTILMVEVKPSKQTRPPVKKGKKRQYYIEECMTYVTNSCKWEAAEAYAKKAGYEFAIWDEHVLKKMGILKW